MTEPRLTVPTDAVVSRDGTTVHIDDPRVEVTSSDGHTIKREPPKPAPTTAPEPRSAGFFRPPVADKYPPLKRRRASALPSYRDPRTMPRALVRRVNR